MCQSSSYIRVGDAISVLRGMTAESIDCCITSPPYWGLRDYGIAPSIWGGQETALTSRDTFMDRSAERVERGADVSAWSLLQSYTLSISSGYSPKSAVFSRKAGRSGSTSAIPTRPREEAAAR